MYNILSNRYLRDFLKEKSQNGRKMRQQRWRVWNLSVRSFSDYLVLLLKKRTPYLYTFMPTNLLGLRHMMMATIIMLRWPEKLRFLQFSCKYNNNIVPWTLILCFWLFVLIPIWYELKSTWYVYLFFFFFQFGKGHRFHSTIPCDCKPYQSSNRQLPLFVTLPFL